MEELTAWQIVLRVAYAVFILGAAHVVGGWLSGVAGYTLERTQVDPLVRRILVKFVRPLVWLLGIGAILHLLALDSVSTSIAAMLGASTLAIGLGLQKYLSDAAAGALLLSTRPFNAGDSVNLGGVTGVINEIGLFFTKIDDFDGNTKFLPNSKVTSNVMENITRKGDRRLSERVTVGRGADVDALRERWMAHIVSDERILKEPAPAIFVAAIREGAVEIAVNIWMKNADWAGAGNALREQVLRDLREHEVPGPQSGVRVELNGERG